MFRPNHFLTPANWHVLGMKKLLQIINSVANNGHRTPLQKHTSIFCYLHSKYFDKGTDLESLLSPCFVISEHAPFLERIGLRKSSFERIGSSTSIYRGYVPSPFDFHCAHSANRCFILETTRTTKRRDNGSEG